MRVRRVKAASGCCVVAWAVLASASAWGEVSEAAPRLHFSPDEKLTYTVEVERSSPVAGGSSAIVEFTGRLVIEARHVDESGVATLALTGEGEGKVGVGSDTEPMGAEPESVTLRVSSDGVIEPSIDEQGRPEDVIGPTMPAFNVGTQILAAATQGGSFFGLSLPSHLPDVGGSWRAPPSVSEVRGVAGAGRKAGPQEYTYLGFKEREGVQCLVFSSPLQYELTHPEATYYFDANRGRLVACEATIDGSDRDQTTLRYVVVLQSPNG